MREERFGGWADAALVVARAEAVVASAREQAAAVVAAVGPSLACAAVGVAVPTAAGRRQEAVAAVASAAGGPGARLETLFVAVGALDTVLGGGAGAVWLLVPDPVLGGASPARALAEDAGAGGQVLAAARGYLAARLRDGQ